uniref:ORF14 n=1 Tax=Nitrosopumilaceae spindle-shaped virus TaxID=3065433 RepID=A0AAT9J746_9VIRU
MIPKTSLYKGTVVDSVKTMIDVNKLLAKFGIQEKRLTQQGGDKSYFEFIIRKDNDVSLMIKIKIPFIEKGSRYSKEYDEARSYRYFYHYLKALLSAKEAEMYSIEEIFMAHIVMKLPSGESVTLGDQLVKQIESGNTPMLNDFEVVGSKEKPKLELRKIETQ